tara:strand:- start:452 stop:709 length:258 start_codon:yes stop_codon:yes gene_type:complete
MDLLYNENLWTVGHFFMWMIVGRFLFKSWIILIILSVAWEAIEYYLPYEIAKEPWFNKFTDLIANSLGFYVGLKIRKYFEKENNS